MTPEQKFMAGEATDPAGEPTAAGFPKETFIKLPHKYLCLYYIILIKLGQRSFFMQRTEINRDVAYRDHSE